MKKRLLSFALVLAMAVAIFAPGVSALAEGTDDISLLLEHDNWTTYGDSLWVGVYFLDANGWYCEDDFYWEHADAPSKMTILNDAGEAIWSKDYVLDEICRDRYFRFDQPEMKAWASGTYTMQVEVVIDGKTFSRAFDFWLDGWNGAEPAFITLISGAYYQWYGLYIEVDAYVWSEDSEPVQGYDVNFRLLYEDGAEVGNSSRTTYSNGATYAEFDLYDGRDAYGHYIVEISVEDSDGNRIIETMGFDFLEKKQAATLTPVFSLEAEYCYGQYLELEVQAFDENGDPARGAEIHAKILNGDGTSLDKDVFWGTNSYLFAADSVGRALIGFDFFDENLPKGEYILVLTSGEASLELPFTYTGMVEPKTITPYDGVKSVYHYGEDAYLKFRVVGENDKPAAYQNVLFEILNADGTPSDVGLIYRDQTSAYQRADSDGIATVNLDFGYRGDAPAGDYILRVSIGGLSIKVPFTYAGIVEPYAIEAYDGVRDAYYYREDAYLTFRVIGENGIPAAYQDVLFEILNADGTPSDVGFIFNNRTSRYAWTDVDGFAEVNLDFSVDPDFPSGDYILRVSAGEASLDVKFTYYGKVEPQEITLARDAEPVYYYGQYIDLLFYVTGEHGAPSVEQGVYFELLDANGDMIASDYRWTDMGGFVRASLDLSGAGAVPAGTYTLTASVGDVSTTVEIVYGGKVAASTITLESEVQPAYYAEQDVYLYFYLEGKNGAAVHDDVLFEILNADGTPSDVGLIWYNCTSSSVLPYYYGEVNVNLYFDGDTTPVGSYILRVSSGSASLDVPIVYGGKVVPYAITAGENVCPEYYYGQDVYLSFNVTGKNGEPFSGEDAFFEILNADGTPSDVGLIWAGIISDYRRINNGSVNVNLYFENEKQAPKGNYILRVTVRDVTAEFSFAVTYAEPQMNLAVFNYETDDNSRFKRGDWIGINVYLSYPNGINNYYDDVFYDSPLHWWIKDANGKVVFEETLHWYNYSKYASFDTSKADWADGTYTVVAEVTGELGTYRAERSFYYSKDGNWPDPAPVYAIGDVNCDGQVNGKDYMLLKRHILKTFVLSKEGLAVADINGDGKVNGNDYMLLKRAVMHTYVIKDYRNA